MHIRMFYSEICSNFGHLVREKILQICHSNCFRGVSIAYLHIFPKRGGIASHNRVYSLKDKLFSSSPPDTTHLRGLQLFVKFTTCMSASHCTRRLTSIGYSRLTNTREHVYCGVREHLVNCYESMQGHERQ